MISDCYFTSGALLAVSGYLFHQQVLTGVTLTAIWTVMFFFASSAAYLTVSEVFPMEVRAMAIALFYAIATGLGGITGPVVFGQLIGTGDQPDLLIGFAMAAGPMIAAAVMELILGVRAEQKSLESVATPLNAMQEETSS
jgi:MFS family permease